MYRERPSTLTGAVLWTSDRTGDTRVLPDGCMDVLWFGDHLLVAGPDTTAQMSSVPPGTTVTGLRLPPGSGPSVLGVPAVELRDVRVRLDQLWAPALVRPLNEQVAAAGRAGPVLEALARDRLVTADPAPRQITGIVEMLHGGAGVAAVADEVGWSERQLHRRSVTAFGYGLKTLSRVLRLHRALDLVRAGVPPGDTAVRAGYADQAHLARDVKDLAGVPLGTLMA